MGLQRIEVTADSAAEPEAIYALLVDGSSWPSWSRFDSFELEAPGEGGGDASLGAIRVFRLGRWVTSREEIAELVPGRRYSYLYLSGLPVLDYRADVDLEPTDGGTRILWRSSFRPKYPGTGWAYRLMVIRFIRDTATRVAQAAA
jgi:hypothetical protein